MLILSGQKTGTKLLTSTTPIYSKSLIFPQNSINSMYNTTATNPSISMPISDDDSDDEHSGRITRPRARRNQFSPENSINSIYNTTTTNPNIPMPISDDDSDENSGRITRPPARRKPNKFRSKTELTRRLVRQLAKWWPLIVFLLAMALLGFEASRISPESSSEFTRSRRGFAIVNNSNLNRLDHKYHTVAGVKQILKIRSVKVCNLSLGASEQDIKEFFSFSGDIEHVQIQSGNERSQTAYVTFKEAQGAETAALLSGATIVDQAVTIALAPDYNPPATTSALPMATDSNLSTGGTPVQKAVDVVTSMLAKGFVLGKDALNIAKTFDETHQFTSTAAATVASIDQKIGLSEKITLVNEKMREVDQKFQVSEKTKSAFEAAEQTLSSAGSAAMKNLYILTGTSWVTGAFNRVAKARVDESKNERKSGGGRKMKKRGRGLL